jgi:hypothetical protein
VSELVDARRIAAADFEVIARTLRRRIALRTTDLAVYEAMRYLECDPEIQGYPARHLVLRVETDRGVYRIVENGRILHQQVNPRAIVEYLYGHLFGESLQDDPEAPLIHGACLRRNNRRLLLVGAKGTGKTTLTLRLMLAGYDIEGDENVFVFADAAVARPRALHVKQAALPLLPELADMISRRPYLEDYLGQRIYNVDPRCVTSSWQIRHAPIDLVILLRANHGGYSSIRPVPPLALVREIMTEAGLPPSQRGAAIGAVIAMCARAKGFDLSLGEHAGAIACIDAVCASAH